MAPQTRRRVTGRLIAPIFSLLFVGVVAAACGASTGMSTTLGLKASAAAAAIASPNPCETPVIRICLLTAGRPFRFESA